MFILLSPAKKLLPISKPYSGNTTEPTLINKAIRLAKLMKSNSIEDLAQLMDLSQALAKLNYDRYQQFNLQNPSLTQSYPALLLFKGDVYQGLSATNWTEDDLNYSQTHLGILSGLYGILRPLDRIQPYRLEMGVNLANPKGANLYEFWRESITKALNTKLALDANPVLINLSSIEYFKAIDTKILKFPILSINFYEQKNNETKIIGIYAKKARGLMAKYLIQNRVKTIDKIKSFSESGYRFCEISSSEKHLNFVRIH
ncbi:MAG: peroxide stress protein YaaA [Tatlockia sp.]|nr:peroxide stress protein YaaA [Tatlockia sp.]